MAWQWLAFGAPVNQRSIEVGGGAAHLDLVTVGLVGKILSIEVKLNKPGHVKVANGPLTIVDVDLGVGTHSLPVAVADQWVPADLGAVVELTVKWP